MPPPPPSWKGKQCTGCNNKVIGARSFVNETALDVNGHGTHTASTAAGNFVNCANVFGNANGTAAGIAPRAHLAIYKVCTESDGCPSSAIIAAIDAAIEDGKGIFVSFSAGNDGPYYWSIVNGPPWALTETHTIRGKMVVCELIGNFVGEGEAVKNAGGAAMILVNDKEWANTTFANVHVLPAAHVGTLIGNKRAPVVAAFSSRGPNPSSPGILKPDIIGPGVNILAAWPTSVDNNTNTKSTFNIESGTSMSCPHLSGVAALLKSAHPDWSPAAIKSAIMTTADVLNHANNPIEDRTFLPANIFASKQVSSIVNKKVNCSNATSIPEAQLNYPSFALTFKVKTTSSQTYTRKVTNVGDPNSSYNLHIVPPIGIDVHVAPKTLNFSKRNQTMQYSVTFSRLASAPNATRAVKGFLKWCSCKSNCVSSPIAVILM
ncbi:subtilisin-like protease sdd1 [Phtheirospermum japonicum]|uniref:Subtilisin-like protease sdd1 n=1 Tax=Phtheirospermum japonicum TaxID=374723 RepID=A0A830D7I4_9LAMI|nr:subtilisin-like protease sdd1 [Phtheirospermum japonicum]